MRPQPIEPSSYRSFAVRLALAAAVCLPSAASAQVDTVSILLPSALTTGGVTPQSAFAAYGYAPAAGTGAASDVFFTAGFTGTGQDIRSVTGTSANRLIQATAWQMFLRDGDLARSGGVPTPGSLVLNKAAIPGSAIGAYGAAFISDGGGNLQVPAGTVAPDLTRRIYRYNLALDANGDAREEFTSLVTLGDMQRAIGSTNTSANVSRQVALGSNASKVYFVDTSTVYGGLWTVNSLGGGVARLVGDADLSAEPSVRNVGGVDRIYTNGTSGSGNAGGIDYFDTSTNTRQAAVAGAVVADFLEAGTGNVAIASTAVDDAGNVYFLNTSNTGGFDRRGLYRLDTNGKLSKVASLAERTAVTTGTNANSLRLQTRTAMVSGLTVTQVMFQESGTSNLGAYNAFLPGDFNRDGAANQADVGLFKAKLGVRTGAATGTASAADQKFDLNGNRSIDWKDVKVLQQFLPIANGDADMDYDVDRADLDTLAVHYTPAAGALASGTKRWLEGDFTGDNHASYDDLLILVGNYGERPLYPTLAVGGIYTTDFVTDYYRAIAQSVPEPTTLAAVGGLVVTALRRRRQQRKA